MPQLVESAQKFLKIFLRAKEYRPHQREARAILVPNTLESDDQREIAIRN